MKDKILPIAEPVARVRQLLDDLVAKFITRHGAGVGRPAHHAAADCFGARAGASGPP